MWRNLTVDPVATIDFLDGWNEIWKILLTWINQNPNKIRQLKIHRNLISSFSFKLTKFLGRIMQFKFSENMQQLKELLTL